MAQSAQHNGIAVVTGAASGMGQAAARLMVEAGWTLLACDLNAERLDAAAAGLLDNGVVETLAGDIADPGYGDKLAAALAGRPIGALIHCAGLSPSMADSARILEVNLEGGAAVMFASSAGHMLGTMLDEPIGKADTPESVASLVPYAQNPGAAYSISKRGVHLLVKREAPAFGKRGARICSISPGIIDTPMARQEYAVEPAMKHMVDTSPLPRFGQPEEVAAVAVFLCSPAASFCSGIDVLVDGGSMAVVLAGPQPSDSTS
jgi:NAD(P)-dependent dehydrogenase (short-subunit alcohol dehydrogenase family)